MEILIDRFEIIKTEICKIFDNPYDKPTDIIGFSDGGRELAEKLVGVINPKEICFFDEAIKSDSRFHYLDFANMLEKSEIMIFAMELPDKYYKNLDDLNEVCMIFIPKCYPKTISALINSGYAENLIIL